MTDKQVTKLYFSVLVFLAAQLQEDIAQNTATAIYKVYTGDHHGTAAKVFVNRSEGLLKPVIESNCLAMLTLCC